MSYRDSFDFVRELGRGGSATAFLVIEKSSGAQFTLKSLHPAFACDSTVIKRLRRESQILDTLSTPRIAKINRSFLDEDPPALLIEYVDGCNLDQFRTKLPFVFPEMALEVVWHTLLSLKEAHALDITHRDIKPSNILIHNDGRVILSDFGLATVDGSTRLTSQTSFLGTTDYLSPEQVCGDNISHASDIFSVGVILYQLVTGTLPFTRRSIPATLNAIAKETPERPERRNPKLSQELSAMIFRALEKSMERRYATVSHFIDDIEKYFDRIGYLHSPERLSWVVNPSASVMDGLTDCATAITLRAEKALKDNHFEPFVEYLSHLQLKAPESAAIDRLLSQYVKKKRSRKYRQIAVPAAVILFLVITGISWNHRPKPATIAATSPPTPPSPMNKIAMETRLPKKIVTRKTGTVHFNVDEDTQVFLDGKKIAERKLKNVTLGSHWLLLEREGFDPIRAQIVVSAESPTFINLKN